MLRLICDMACEIGYELLTGSGVLLMLYEWYATWIGSDRPEETRDTQYRHSPVNYQHKVNSTNVVTQRFKEQT